MMLVMNALSVFLKKGTFWISFLLMCSEISVFSDGGRFLRIS